MAYVKFDKEFAAAVKQTLTDINEEISLTMSSVSSSFNNKKISTYSSYLKIYDEEGELIADYTGYANRYNASADNGKDRAITIKKNVTAKVSKVIKALEKIISLVDAFESQTGLTLEAELGEDISSVFQFLATYGDASSLSALKGSGVFGNASLNGIYSFDESLLDFDNLSIWSSFGGFLDEQEGDGELENSIREFFLGKLNGYLDENGNVIIDGQDFGSLNSLSMATLLQTDAGQQMKNEFIEGYKDKLNSLMFGEGLSGTGMTPFGDSTEETNGLVTASMLPGAMALMNSVLNKNVESTVEVTEEETRDRMNRLNTALENAVDNAEDPNVVQEMFKEILAQNEFEASDETIALLVEQYTTQKELIENVGNSGEWEDNLSSGENGEQRDDSGDSFLTDIVDKAQENVSENSMKNFITMFEERITDEKFNDWLADNEISLEGLSEGEIADYRASFEVDVRVELIEDLKSRHEIENDVSDRVTDFGDTESGSGDFNRTFVDDVSDAVFETAKDSVDGDFSEWLEEQGVSIDELSNEELNEYTAEYVKQTNNGEESSSDGNIMSENADAVQQAGEAALSGLEAGTTRGKLHQDSGMIEKLESERHVPVAKGDADGDVNPDLNIDTDADGRPTLNIDETKEDVPPRVPEVPKDELPAKVETSQVLNTSSVASGSVNHIKVNAGGNAGMTKAEAPAVESTTTGTSQGTTNSTPTISEKLPEVPVMQSSSNNNNNNNNVSNEMSVDGGKQPDTPKQVDPEVKSSSVIAGAAGAAATTIISGGNSGSSAPVTMSPIQGQVPDVDYVAPAPANPTVSNTPVQGGNISNNMVTNNAPVNNTNVANNAATNNAFVNNAVGHTNANAHASANTQANTSANNAPTTRPTTSSTQTADSSSEVLGKGKSSYGAPADAPSGKTTKAQTSEAKANTDVTHKQERNIEDLDGQVNADSPDGFLGDSSYAELLEKNEKEVKIATGITATSLFATLTLKLTNIIGIVSFVLVLLAIILVYTTFRIKKGKERKKLESLIVIEKINKEKELSVKQAEENTTEETEIEEEIEVTEVEVDDEVSEITEVPEEEVVYEEVVVEEPVLEVDETQEEVTKETEEENVVYEEEIVYVDEDGNVIELPEGAEIVYEEVVVEEPVTEEEIPEKKEFQSAEEVIYGKKNKKTSKKDNA